MSLHLFALYWPLWHSNSMILALAANQKPNEIRLSGTSIDWRPGEAGLGSEEASEVCVTGPPGRRTVVVSQVDRENVVLLVEKGRCFLLLATQGPQLTD